MRIPFVLLVFVVIWLANQPCKAQQDTLSAGPLFDEFDLTLALGERTEAVGPFYYREQEGHLKRWAIPPLFAYTEDSETDYEEFTFLYPVMSRVRYGGQYRWHFFQLLNSAGGPTHKEEKRDRFTIFPIYFQQRSSDPTENYTAVFPFYGHMQNHMFRDDIYFVMFPAYGRTRRRDVVTENYFYPLYHVRHGDGLKGWQLWPFYGIEHKD